MTHLRHEGLWLWIQISKRFITFTLLFWTFVCFSSPHRAAAFLLLCFCFAHNDTLFSFHRKDSFPKEEQTHIWFNVRAFLAALFEICCFVGNNEGNDSWGIAQILDKTLMHYIVKFSTTIGSTHWRYSRFTSNKDCQTHSHFQLDC